MSKLFSKRARFDEVNMCEGRPFLPDILRTIKIRSKCVCPSTNTPPNKNSLAFVAVCGEEMSVGVLFGYTVYISFVAPTNPRALLRTKDELGRVIWIYRIYRRITRTG